MSNLDEQFDEMLDNLAKDTENDQAQKNLLKLADDLEARDKVKYAKVIERCRDYSYHDFNSELDAPKMAMHIDLLAVGLVSEDQRMQDGEFDS